MTPKHRSRPQPGAAAAHSVWRLHGATKKLVDCFVNQTASKLYTVTVVFGTETFVNEIYPDTASAMSRAMQVRDRLLKCGGWTICTPAVGSKQYGQPDGRFS